MNHMIVTLLRELFSYVNGAAEIIDLISWSKQGKS